MKTYAALAVLAAILTMKPVAQAQACYSSVTSWQGSYSLNANATVACNDETCTVNEVAAATVNTNAIGASCTGASWSGTDDVTTAVLNNKAVSACGDGPSRVETIVGSGGGNSSSFLFVQPSQGTYTYLAAPFANSWTQVIQTCDQGDITYNGTNAGLFPASNYPLTFPLPDTVQELTANPPDFEGLALIEGAIAPWTFSFKLTPVYNDDCDCKGQAGSTIASQNQSLGEDVAIVGTGFSLHYEGSRNASAGGNGVATADASMIGGWTLAVHHAYDPGTNTLFLGDGQQRNGYQLGVPVSFNSNTLITSEDGDEVYVFSGSNGRHLKTLRPRTGATEYRFAYDPAGNLVTVTDAKGNVTTIQRDGSGHATAIVSPFGQTTALSLDGNGFLSQVTDPLGKSVTFANTSAGLITARTDANGNTYNYTYAGKGRLIKDADPVGGYIGLARSNAASGLGSTVAQTTAMGQASSSQNTLTLPWVQDGTSLFSEQRTNTWSSGLLATVSSSQQGTMRTEALTLPDSTSFDETMGPDPVWGIQVPVATSETQTQGNLTMNMAASRATTLATVGNPFSVTSSTETETINGRTYTSTFTGSNLTYVDTSPVGRTVIVGLDSLERVLSSQVAGLTATAFAYDSRGRLSSTTQGARKTTYSYGPDGFLASVTDPLKLKTRFAYDADGRLVTTTLPDGRILNHAYDANGNLTSITPPGKSAHDFTYTAVDQPASYAPPTVLGTGPTTYAYDLDRNLTTVTRPDSQAINYGYDSAARMISVGTPTGTSSFTYSPTTGNLATAGRGSQHITYSYNGPLLTKSTWKGTVAGSVSRNYDDNFWITSQGVGGGINVALHYDNDGLLTKAGSLTIKRSSTNGLITGTTLGVATDKRTYDSFGELTGYTASDNGATVYKTQYTRDADGRVTATNETLGAATKNIATDSYTYDTNSNRLSATTSSGTANGTYDAQDRLLTYGNTSYTYTANGDLASQKVGSQKTTYKYDVLGNLTSATLPNGTKLTYIIDAENHRVGKTVNGVLTTGFLYDDDRVVAQLNGSSQLVSQFVYATELASPDFMVSGGVTYRIFSDHLGSPVLVVNTSSGAIAQQIIYDEFGNVLSDTNPGFQPFGFAGGLYDQDVKLVRFGARDYNPVIGRWTAKDPISFASSDTNLYAYVHNDPVNLVDLDGLDGVLVLVNPGGRSANDRAVSSNVSSYVSPDGTFTVVAHGVPGEVLGPNHKAMSAEDLARAITRSPEWDRNKYKKIRLLVCRSGLKDKNGKSIRDELSRELRGVTVEAPETRVGIKSDGSVIAVDSKGRSMGPATFVPSP